MRLPVALVAVALAARVVLAAGTEIYPDEAYYWTWAQAPQLSYFDHPAMIAWLIAVLGIRTGALLCGLAALAGVHRLARELGADRDRAWWATALFASTPAAALLGTIATPDAPLLAFWAWALVALVRQRAIATGLLWGLAMLSKYNGILLGLPVLVVFFRKPRQLLLATVIALVITSPTIAWNAMNDWEGFRFQLDHGLGGGGGLATFGEFLGGQLLMAGPVLALLAVDWLARMPANRVLKLATVLPLVFFGYASWRARGEANWAAAAWLSASVGLAMTPWVRWLRAAVAVNLLALVIGTGLLVAPPEPLWATPPVRKLHGWATLARAQEQAVPVITNRYQLSALVTKYAGLPSTTVGSRRSQYDLWPHPPVPAGSDALWVGDGEGPSEHLLGLFESSQTIDWQPDARQRALHPFVVVRLVRAKADLWQAP